MEIEAKEYKWDNEIMFVTLKEFVLTQHEDGSSVRADSYVEGFEEVFDCPDCAMNFIKDKFSLHDEPAQSKPISSDRFIFAIADRAFEFSKEFILESEIH